MLKCKLIWKIFLECEFLIYRLKLSSEIQHLLSVFI